jgi:ribosomal protein S27AE
VLRGELIASHDARWVCVGCAITKIREAVKL